MENLSTKTKEINYSLNNVKNFNKELNCDLEDVVNKLSQLLIEYFKFILETIKLEHSNFSKFIIIRGLDTILNVFYHILLFTKHLDVTYFHCQKAFYFYVEFVGQISEDEKMFLQLSSKDATMYVYKKTIFEISNEHRKTNEVMSEATKRTFELVNANVTLYKTLLLYLINHDFKNVDGMKNLEEVFKRLNKLTDKTLVQYLNPIVDKLFHSIKDVNKFYTIVQLVIKKTSKQPELLQNVSSKLVVDDLLDKLEESPDKFISWFL